MVLCAFAQHEQFEKQVCGRVVYWPSQAPFRSRHIVHCSAKKRSPSTCFVVFPPHVEWRFIACFDCFVFIALCSVEEMSFPVRLHCPFKTVSCMSPYCRMFPRTNITLAKKTRLERWSIIDRLLRTTITMEVKPCNITVVKLFTKDPFFKLHNHCTCLGPIKMGD